MKTKTKSDHRHSDINRNEHGRIKQRCPWGLESGSVIREPIVRISDANDTGKNGRHTAAHSGTFPSVVRFSASVSLPHTRSTIVNILVEAPRRKLRLQSGGWPPTHTGTSTVDAGTTGWTQKRISQFNKLYKGFEFQRDINWRLLSAYT